MHILEEHGGVRMSFAPLFTSTCVDAFGVGEEGLIDAALGSRGSTFSAALL